jgi:peptidoglycan/LPS O-acetylase OafA/YrhL
LSALAIESPVAASRAPDALAPPPGNPRFPLFDGLRAIAALSIVVTHCAAITGFNTGNPLGAYTARLNMGVAFFFVISGFLLYRPFLAARFAGRPVPRIRDYARRRVLRIVPAYWVALVVLGATVGLCGVFTGDWWKYFLFAQSYSSATVICGIGAAWSLAIEASFYVALPLWALLMDRLQRGRGARTMLRIEIAGLLGVSLLSIAVRTWAYADLGHQSAVDTTLLGNADWFAWGMALALASVVLSGRERSSRAVRIVADRPWLPWLAAAVLIWLDSTQLGMQRSFPPLYTDARWLEEHLLFPAIGVLLALPAVFGNPARGLPRRILGNRGLAWVGLVSYGIFLWHQPLIQPLTDHGALDLIPGMPFPSLVLSLTVVSAAVAATSYYLLERPILRFKDSRRRPEAATASPAPATAG